MADTLLEQGANGTTLSQTVTATAFYTLTYNWAISKSANPSVLNLFKNDTGTVNYTITVTNDEGTVQRYIKGTVKITNGGTVEATEGLASTLVLTYPPSTVPVVTQSLDVSIHPVLLPGETFEYPYQINLTAGQFILGSTFKITANTTITNHSGHDEPFGPSTSASGPIPTSTTPVNQSINVTDTNGQLFTFNATSPQTPQSQSYTKDFSCNTDEGSHTNTATIVQTGQSASAAVLVNCYDLTVTKTAVASFTRTYSWTISKKAVDNSGATISALTLATGESYTAKYVIDVMPTFTDSNFAVSGTIKIVNPNPGRDATVMISDLISPDISAAISEPTVTVPANDSKTVTYSAILPNAANRTDQATALLFNIPSGTTAFKSDAVAIDFSKAVITEVDACINVYDSFAGALNTLPVCHDSAEFTYYRTIGPYYSCSSITDQITNTVVFTTSTTQTTGSASWTITVTVPCSGCTLTIGFWKTHAGLGPGNQPNLVSPLLPISLGTLGGLYSLNVTTAAQAVSILNFGGSNGIIDASNGINKLYAQLLAARLNIKNGANGNAIASTLQAADAFLATHNSGSWAVLSRAQRTQVNNWAAILDSYNNGLIGPGHCSEQSDTTLSSSSTNTAAQSGDSGTDSSDTGTDTDNCNRICTPCCYSLNEYNYWYRNNLQ